MGDLKEPSRITVNSTTYLIGTYRHFETDHFLREHGRHNEQGGVGRDLDEFGFGDYSSNSIISPGDVITRDVRLDSDDDSDDEEELEDYLNGLRWVMAEKTKEENSDHFVYLDEDDPNYEYWSDWGSKSFDAIQREIDKTEADLHPYLCYRENRPLQITYSVVLTVKSKEEVLYQKYFGMKLHEVQKKLATSLFGNRKTINVKKLDIGVEEMVLRLPVEMKLNVQELSVLRDLPPLCEVLDQFVDVSFPLKKVWTECIEEPMTQLPIRTALKL
uniref:Ribosomal_L9_C domain-containing protein n=1 Tax=Caenorhabditis tropicalis TaxID=1561998 RepID=A0A1I7UDS2_9PELO